MRRWKCTYNFLSVSGKQYTIGMLITDEEYDSLRNFEFLHFVLS